jgi:NAD+ synthase
MVKTYGNAKVKGFVVGISGGVDSAVTSTLCAQTGLAVLCIEMPIHQHDHVSRGREHIEQLKNDSLTCSTKKPILPRFLKRLKEVLILKKAN